MSTMKKLFSSNLVKSAAICGLMLAPFMQSNAANKAFNFGQKAFKTVGTFVKQSTPMVKSGLSETQQRVGGFVNKNMSMVKNGINVLDKNLTDSIVRNGLKVENFINKASPVVKGFMFSPAGQLMLAGAALTGVGTLAVKNQDDILETIANAVYPMYNAGTKRQIVKDAKEDQDELNKIMDKITIELQNGTLTEDQALREAEWLQSREENLYEEFINKMKKEMNDVDKKDIEEGKRKINEKWGRFREKIGSNDFSKNKSYSNIYKAKYNGITENLANITLGTSDLMKQTYRLIHPVNNEKKAERKAEREAKREEFFRNAANMIGLLSYMKNGKITKNDLQNIIKKKATLNDVTERAFWEGYLEKVNTDVCQTRQDLNDNKISLQEATKKLQQLKRLETITHEELVKYNSNKIDKDWKTGLEKKWQEIHKDLDSKKTT